MSAPVLGLIGLPGAPVGPWAHYLAAAASRAGRPSQSIDYSFTTDEYGDIHPGVWDAQALNTALVGRLGRGGTETFLGLPSALVDSGAGGEVLEELRLAGGTLVEVEVSWEASFRAVGLGGAAPTEFIPIRQVYRAMAGARQEKLRALAQYTLRGEPPAASESAGEDWRSFFGLE